MLDVGARGVDLVVEREALFQWDGAVSMEGGMYAKREDTWTITAVSGSDTQFNVASTNYNFIYNDDIDLDEHFNGDISFVQIASAPNTSDPYDILLEYEFDSGDIVDLSGNGNNATLVGATLNYEEGEDCDLECLSGLYDCLGICGGTNLLDCAGFCNGPVVEDCLGECGGEAAEDCEGICNGDAVIDCADICNGNTEIDCEGVCGGDAIEDCAGFCNGPLIEDCAGECGGDAVEDSCGECGGDDSSCTGCADPDAINYNPDATMDGCCLYYDDVSPDVFGDLNGDGNYDVVDVILLVNLALGID